MSKKWIIIEIFAILIVFIGTICFKFYPEYKKTIGSSDTFINVEKYNYLVEFQLENGIDFAIIVNTEEEVSNLLFYNEEALSLYNQNIEGKKLEQGVKDIINILIEKEELKEGENITITRYKEESIHMKNIVEKLCKNNNITVTWKEKKLVEKLEELQIEVIEEETEQLKLLEEYSKEIIRFKKNHISSKPTYDNEESGTDISKEEVTKYANNVYQKLELYVKSNNIKDQEITDSTLLIQLIPGDKEAKYYPASASWYYIKNEKVYAYIEFKINDIIYHYCYNGSEDDYKEGVC